MFLLRRPSPADVDRALDQARGMALSYDQPGMVNLPPAGFQLDEYVVTIGRGQQDFNRARDALLAWKHYDFGWVEVCTSQSSIEPGTVLMVSIRHLGFWSLNGGRVLTRYDQTGDRRAVGFTYGTLEDHAECGEELFEVFLDAATGDVKYRIRAVSRPRAPLARLGRPFVRWLQGRFRRDSGEAMRRALRLRP